MNSVIWRDEIIDKCPLAKEEILALLAAFMSVSQWIDIYYAMAASGDAEEGLRMLAKLDALQG